MTVFTTFDIVFFVVTLLFASVACYRGVVKELFGFLNWIIALVLSYLISPFIADLLKNFFKNRLILDIGVRAIIFLICYITFIIATSGFSRDLSDSINIYLNRILGLFFGAFKSLIIFGLVYAFYNCFFDFALGSKLAKKEERRLPEWYYQSHSSGSVTYFGEALKPLAKGFIDFVISNLSKSMGNYKIDIDKELIDKMKQEGTLNDIIDKVNSNSLNIDGIKQQLDPELYPNKNVEDSTTSNSQQSNLDNNSEKPKSDSGYNKKDIEKMHRLIEIINN